MPFPCSCVAAPSTESVAPESLLLRDTQAYFALRAGPDAPRTIHHGLGPVLPPLRPRDLSLCPIWASLGTRSGRLHPGGLAGDCCAFGHFRHDSRYTYLRTWIATLARNKAIDFVREHYRHPRDNLSDLTLVDLPSHGFDPAVECEQHGMQALVRNALAELAPQVSATSFRVLYLRSIEERTVPEVASELGLTSKQVRFRHHRMKQKLRRQIEVLAGDTYSGGGAEPSD